MNSMTGYGRAEVSSGQINVVCEARSVNHRALELRIRIPQELNPIETEIRGLVRDYFSRGSIQLSIAIDAIGNEQATLNMSAARRLADDLARLKMELDMPGEVSLEMLSRFPQIMRSSVGDIEEEKLWNLSRKVVKKALAALVKERRREGEATRRVIKDHLGILSGIAREIRSKSSGANKMIKENIEKKVLELIEAEAMDQRRLEEEAAFLATRRDISEETNRLAEHLSDLKKTLAKPGPIGRKLEFLCQEVHRELNTMASKAPGSGIDKLTIQARVELEKIKEQVYNVE